MAKQPYLPLYTGDYFKDTRKLPLSVRGAWIDLMIFMWDSPRRGVIIHTMVEYAQMMSCTFDEANFVIGVLQDKEICDFEIAEKNQIKLICRRMVRDAALSKKRSRAGKKGMNSRYSEEEVCYNKTPNKTVTTSDNVIDTDNATELKLKEAFDEIYLDQEPMKWQHLDFFFELETFCNKVRGSPEDYNGHDRNGIRKAFQYQLRNSKGKPKNGQQTSTDKSTAHVNSLMEGYKRRNSGTS